MNIGLACDLKEDVLLSGNQSDDTFEEYDSRGTVGNIAAALESLGNRVAVLGGGKEFLANILQNHTDFVFNIAEGRGNSRNREAQVPAILEMLNVPYSGSDPQCLSICLDKPMTKKLVSAAGVPTPRWKVLTSNEQIIGLARDSFPFPVFLKPVHEGSSKGIHLGFRFETPEPMIEVATVLLDRYQQPVLAEEFIDGEEVTVGIIGNSSPKVVGIMRIIPCDKRQNFIYSLEVKRNWEELVDYECPAQLDAGILEQVKKFSLRAYEVLGCRDFARVDFRIDRAGKPYFLEINPLPGLNPKSGDFVILARKMGWSYEALLSAILNAALDRYPECVRR